MGNIQPKSISGAQHIAAFDEMAENRLALIQSEPVITYLIDTVSASALPYLAEQFDVAGNKGYKQATTDAQRREIIRKAILLKRKLGTPWAIRQALTAVGYGSEATIVERVGTDPLTGWAEFRIDIDLGDSVGISGTLEDEATALINEYKNARSHLTSINYKAIISDTLVVPVDDDILIVGLDSGDTTDTVPFTALLYDGTWFYNGGYNYDVSKNESMSVNII